MMKRLLDVAVAGLALLVISPLVVIVTLAIRLEDGRPAIFRQQRVGRDSRPFTLYKFRSMPRTTPDVPSANAGALRVTRVGRIIRRTNIDELPQLWNVVRGDMSIVGPRPALPSQTTLLAERAKHGVDRLRPGLTGLAQVNAYDGMPESEKVSWEARYAGRVGVWTDVIILARTVAYLLRRPPVY